MSLARILAALVVASALAIVACSGGGTSGGPSVTQTLPTESPTPSPTPTDTDHGGVPDTCELRQRPQMNVNDPTDDRLVLGGKADGFFSCPEMQLPTPTPTATPTPACQDADCIQQDRRECVDGHSLSGESPAGRCAGTDGHCVYDAMTQVPCEHGCQVGSWDCNPTPTPTVECPPANADPAEGTHFVCGSSQTQCTVEWVIGRVSGNCLVTCGDLISGDLFLNAIGVQCFVTPE